jgi:hypothetical protein
MSSTRHNSVESNQVPRPVARATNAFLVTFGMFLLFLIFTALTKGLDWGSFSTVLPMIISLDLWLNLPRGDRASWKLGVGFAGVLIVLSAVALFYVWSAAMASDAPRLDTIVIWDLPLLWASVIFVAACVAESLLLGPESRAFFQIGRASRHTPIVGSAPGL